MNLLHSKNLLAACQLGEFKLAPQQMIALLQAMEALAADIRQAESGDQLPAAPPGKGGDPLAAAGDKRAKQARRVSQQKVST